MSATDPHGSSRPFTTFTQDAKIAEKTLKTWFCLWFSLRALRLRVKPFFGLDLKTLPSHPFAMLTQDTKITKETHYSGFDLQPWYFDFDLALLRDFVTLCETSFWFCPVVVRVCQWLNQFYGFRFSSCQSEPDLRKCITRSCNCLDSHHVVLFNRFRAL